MRIYFYIVSSIIYLMLTSSGYSQVNPDSTKINDLKNYLRWSTNYGQQKKFDSAIKYDRKALLLALELNELYQDVASFNHAKINFWKANTVESKKHLSNLLGKSTTHDSLKFRSNILLSQVYSFEQNYKEALKSAISAETIMIETGIRSQVDSLNMMDVYVIKGSVNRTLGNYSKAIEMYDEALNYNADAGYGSYILYYKSGVSEEQENLEQAIAYTKEALDVAQKANAKVYLPTYYLALSDYYLKLKNGDRAHYFAKTGLIDNDDCHLDGLRLNVGKASFLRGDYHEALLFFDDALKVENIEVPQAEIHKNLRDTYTVLNQFEKAIEHNEIYLRLKDSTDALRMQQEVLEITERYESNKKELEIEMLSAKNSLNNTIIEKQRNQIWFTGLFLALALGCIALIGWFFQKLKKQKQHLYHKNVLLAKRLQEKKSVDLVVETKPITAGDALKLESSKKDELIDKIESLLTTNFYLDKTMSLAKMAKLIETNTTYLSKIVNARYEKGFTHFLNDNRITYTLNMLESDDHYKSLTIEHIAEKAGFASSSAFYNAFKRFTGLTPSYYIKQKLLQPY